MLIRSFLESSMKTSLLPCLLLVCLVFSVTSMKLKKLNHKKSGGDEAATAEAGDDDEAVTTKKPSGKASKSPAKKTTEASVHQVREQEKP